MRLVLPVAVLVVLLLGCSSESATPESTGTVAPGEADGLWLLTSLEFAEELLALDEPHFLQVAGNEVGGDTVCNSFGGEFGSRDYTSTTKGCEPDGDPTIDRHQVQDAMIEAVLAGPQVSADRLTFTTSSIELIYQQVEDPTPAQLFAVLDDETKAASTDEIYLDPEAGSHRDYDRLVRLSHPSTDTRFFIGVDDELVCFIVSTDNASSSICQEPRFAARRSWAFGLANQQGPVGVNSALIPDAFVTAFETRPDLGQIAGNILLVSESTPAGKYRIEEPGGQRFTLDVVGLL